MLRLRHTGRLLGDIARYAITNRAWWILPVMLVLLGLMLLVTAGQTAVPYTMYTLF